MVSRSRRGLGVAQLSTFKFLWVGVALVAVGIAMYICYQYMYKAREAFYADAVNQKEKEQELVNQRAAVDAGLSGQKFAPPTSIDRLTPTSDDGVFSDTLTSSQKAAASLVPVMLQRY